MSITTLRVALAGGDRYDPLYRRLEEFTRETGYSVEIARQLPLPDLMEHLHLALDGGEPYHLVSAHSQYTAGLAPYLAPLDDLLPAEELQAFSSLSLGMCECDGRRFQLPRSVETRLLFYRNDVFDDRREKDWYAEASGGRELRVPPTWDELAAVAQYFTRAGKMYGFAFPGRGPGLVWSFAEVVTTVGGTFFDPDGRPRFYSRAGEWALTLLRDLYRRWEAAPPETPDCGFDDVSEVFRAGRAALACDFPNTARLLNDPSFSAVAGWHSVQRFPAGTGGRRAVWTGCPTFAIPASCPEPEPAVALLRFLTNHESQLAEAEYGAIPSRVTAYEEAKEALFEGTIGHRRFTLAEATLRDDALIPPAIPQYWQIEERLWPLLQQAITADRDVTEALELGQRGAEELLGSASEGPVRSAGEP